MELRRYKELKLLERAGEISDLIVHPVFPFYYRGLDFDAKSVSLHGFDYIADFQYFDDEGKLVIEDVKGGKVTDVYALKKRLIEGYYGFQITEIRYRK